MARRKANPSPHELAVLLLAARSRMQVATDLRRWLGRFETVRQARVWLIGPGDRCDRCPMLAKCPDRTSCLRLVSADGRIDSDRAVRRLPIGVGSIGGAAGDGRIHRVQDVRSDPGWRGARDWAVREGVRGFVAMPLRAEGAVTGVFAVFLSTAANEKTPDDFNAAAGLAGAALTMARAFEDGGSREEGPGAPDPGAPGDADHLDPHESDAGPGPDGVWTERQIRAFERKNLARALQATAGRIYGPDGAAARLGIRPTTLASRLRVAGLRPPSDA